MVAREPATTKQLILLRLTVSIGVENKVTKAMSGAETTAENNSSEETIPVSRYEGSTHRLPVHTVPEL